MCLRVALGDQRGEKRMPLADFATLVREWSERWCLTAAGREYWSGFAWDCMRYATEQPADFPFEDASRVALHIRLADHVTAVGVRADTKQWVEALQLRQPVVLRSPATVEWLFATPDQLNGKMQMHSSICARMSLTLESIMCRSTLQSCGRSWQRAASRSRSCKPRASARSGRMPRAWVSRTIVAGVWVAFFQKCQHCGRADRL